MKEEQFLALTPGKHQVVDTEGRRYDVVSNTETNHMSDVPGSREVILREVDDPSNTWELGWHKGHIVDDECCNVLEFNSSSVSVVEV
jgi:hypothetical protein